MNQSGITFWSKVVLGTDILLFIVKANTEQEFRNKVRKEISKKNPAGAYNATFKYTSNSGPFNPNYPGNQTKSLDEIWSKATVIE